VADKCEECHKEVPLISYRASPLIYSEELFSIFDNIEENASS
jgi:hypothetical protein